MNISSILQLQLHNLKSDEKYVFEHSGWIQVTDDHDGWTEIPLQQDDMLSGDSHHIFLMKN